MSWPSTVLNVDMRYHLKPSSATRGKRQDAKAMPAEPRASNANLGRPVLLKRLDDAIAHLSRKQQHYDYFDKLSRGKAARKAAHTQEVFSVLPSGTDCLCGSGSVL